MLTASLRSAVAVAGGICILQPYPSLAQLELTITGSVEPEFGFIDQDRDQDTGYLARPSGGFASSAEDLAPTPAAAPPGARSNPTALGDPANRFDTDSLFSAAPGLLAVTPPVQTSSLRSYGSTTRLILRFNATGTADNGLNYGIRVRLDDNEDFGNEPGNLFGDPALRTRGGLYIRELWGYASGRWGELRAGESPIAYRVLATDIPQGRLGVDEHWNRYVTFPAGTFDPEDFNTSILTRDDTGHPSGITYLLTDIRGFSFGIGYAPTTQGFERTPDLAENNAGFSDVVSLAGRYGAEYAGIRFAIAAGVNFASAEDIAPSQASPAGDPTNAREDITEWRVGAEVQYAGLTVSGFYQASGEGGYRQTAVQTAATDGLASWGAGAAYAAGPWTLAVNYLQVQGDPVGSIDRPVNTGAAIDANGLPPGFGTRDQASSLAIGGGVSYTLAPGLEPFASLVYFDAESVFISDPAINGVSDFSNSGIVGVVGIYFAF